MPYKPTNFAHATGKKANKLCQHNKYPVLFWHAPHSKKEPGTERKGPIVAYEHLLTEFDSLYSEHQSTVARDLKINFKRIIEDSSLTREEAALVTLAVASSLKFREFITSARTTLKIEGVDPSHIQEAEESAAIMGMLNTYYRFRHYMENSGKDAEYGMARLRMQSLANPQLGKARFEMLAFAVSIINGCEKCISSHEKALCELGEPVEKLHDLARLAAALKGLQSLPL